MARLVPAVEPEVTFEVDRFNASGDRLEIAGRWFGVRGRRFLRPTLEVEADGRRHRVLARLDHKPWAARDGEEWLAAFDWDEETGPVASAELAVGADLTVEVTPPSGNSKDRRQPSAAERELTAIRAELDRTNAELADARAARTADRDDASERLRAEQAANRTTLDELGEVRAAREEADHEVERLSKELRRLTDALQEAHEERDSAVSARDAAVSARDEAVSAGATAAMEVLDGTADKWEGLQADLDGALDRLRSTAGERDAALAQRDEARAQRDAAQVERDRALDRRANDEGTPAPAPPATASDEAVAREPAAWRVRAIAAGAVALPVLTLVVLTVFDI